MDPDSELTEEGRFIAKMIQDMAIINSVSRTLVDARSAALLEVVHSAFRASPHDTSPPNFASLKKSVVNRTRELANKKLAALADDHMAHASLVFQILETMLEEETQ